MTKELEVYRGDTTTILCSITRNRVAFDLTGYNIILTLKHKYQDTDDSIVFTKLGVIDSPTTGVGRIELSETDTDLETKKYVYDVKIYKDDKSDIKTILSGIFTVYPVARLEVPE
jgi:hypothetical protein